MFDSVATTLGVLEVTAEFAENVTFNRERLAKSLSAGHLDATTMADYLVYKVLFWPRESSSAKFRTNTHVFWSNLSFLFPDNMSFWGTKNYDVEWCVL